MFLVCLQQTQRKLSPTWHILLSTHSNTSRPIRKLWVEVYSKAWWREMLNFSFQGQNIERWTSFQAPGEGSTHLHLCMAGICRVCWEEELPAGFGMGNPPQPSSPSDSPMKQHSSSRELVFCFFPREVRSYFYTLVTAFGLSVKRGRFHSKCFGWHFLRNSRK